MSKRDWKDNKIPPQCAQVYWLWLIGVPMLVGLGGAMVELVVRLNAERTLDGALLLAGIFFAVVAVLPGILLLVAVKETSAWLPFRRSSLVLEPSPGVIGGKVQGHILVPGSFPEDVKFRLTLRNYLQFLASDSSKPGGARLEEELEWKKSITAQKMPSAEGTFLKFSFDVPGHLQGSRDFSRKKWGWVWQMDLKADISGKKAKATYEIPVILNKAITPSGDRTEKMAAAPAMRIPNEGLDDGSMAIVKVIGLHQIPKVGLMLHCRILQGVVRKGVTYKTAAGIIRIEGIEGPGKLLDRAEGGNTVGLLIKTLVDEDAFSKDTEFAFEESFDGKKGAGA